MADVPEGSGPALLPLAVPACMRVALSREPDAGGAGRIPREGRTARRCHAGSASDIHRGVMGTKPKHRPSQAASAEVQLRTFIAKFAAKDQRLIRAVRTAIRKRFPTANELVWDNYNFFVIGYSPTERPSDAIISIAARANGVGLCFIHGAGLPDPNKVLLGSGSQTRFVRLESAFVLARPDVEALLAAAVARANVPFPAAGRGKLIIRSVSATQRPRRRVPR